MSSRAAVSTFISQNDWSGKTVISFMTNAGWPGNVIKNIKTSCKGAEFRAEKEIKFSSSKLDSMVTSEEKLDNCINSIIKNK